MNIIETIRTRKSIRNYDNLPLTDTETRAIQSAIDGTSSPFGGKATIRLQKFETRGKLKPGTYGVISGAGSFLLMAYADSEKNELSAGYMLEKIILDATALSLGTCWLGGTFSNSDFDRNQIWPEGETLKIVSPIGHSSGRTSLLERLEHLAVNSASRKPFGELFFHNDFNTPLQPDDTCFGLALEMLRLAPSSLNRQPWRALVCDNEIHFYYRNNASRPVLDCGIALCHFHATQLHKGNGGIFFKTDDAPEPPSGLSYLISYKN